MSQLIVNCETSPTDRPSIPPQLCDVLPDHVEMLWPQVEPLISRATARSRGKETAEDIRQLLLSRKAVLWVWWESGAVELLAVAQIDVHPQRMVGRIRLAAGRGTAERFRQCTEVIEAWARDQGAAAMAFFGREGWEPVLAPLGYERTMVCLEKELNHG